MRFRTHVGRRLDLNHNSNRLIVGLSLVAAAAAGVVMLTSDIDRVWVAPLHTFLTWAFVREIDPDHDWTALAAGFAAGVWVISALEVVSILAVGGLLVSARLVLNSTGRRPLTTDLAALAILASAISFTPEGWVAGSGLALALYVDDRMSGQPTIAGVVSAALAGLGASVVATLSTALPEGVPELRPGLALLVGATVMWTILRDPHPPRSVADARHRRPLEQRRLHAARVLAGLGMFAVVLLAGPKAAGVTPLWLGYLLALFSEELGRRGQL